jgi:two-component system, cell cycle response regulator
MSNPHKIALVGFSSFERATFESFFRLAARRPPGYMLVATPAEASLAVVNADDPATMRAAMANKPCAHVMLIGNADGGTGWALQRRPLNLMKVLTNVEQLLTPQAAPAAPAATPPVARVASVAPSRPVAALASGFATTRPFGPLSSSPAPATAPAPAAVGVPSYRPVQVASAPAALASGTAAKAPRNDVRIGMAEYAHSRGSPLVSNEFKPSGFQDDSQMDHILVVDDSDIALKFMRNRLTRFGFRTDLVNSGEEALGRVSARPYKFVFLDVMMEGLDGYQTCRAIKQRKYSEGKPPVVVMLTSRGGTIDKIRGTLAGCDAYLTKPLNERDLIAVLAKHDRTVARGFQETNFGASARSGFGAVPSR